MKEEKHIDMDEITGYDLSRKWFDFAYDNPEKVKPPHAALFFFIVEHCNRLGWTEKFGLPRQMAMDAIGVKNHRTFSTTFEDLAKWGFIKVYEKSKNQYSANIIGVVKNAKATTKALAKATHKHSHKQGYGTHQSTSLGTVCINKPINIKTLNPNDQKNGSATHPRSLEGDGVSSDKIYKDSDGNIVLPRGVPKGGKIRDTNFGEPMYIVTVDQLPAYYTLDGKPFEKPLHL